MAERFLEDARAQSSREPPRSSARLHARYRLGIVSNFYGNLEAVCARDRPRAAPRRGHRLGGRGCEKPDAAIFEAALDALGAEPSRALFVGDSLPRDMAGARALGMPHVLARAGEGGAPAARAIA